MMNARPLAFALTLLLSLLGSGCDDDAPARERCAQCGMFVDLEPGWNAGLSDASGSERVFDSPKCMLRWAGSEDGSGSRARWLVEYYSQERRPLEDIVLVIGSDVTGPMGADLVPVSRGEAAERFTADHGGRVVSPAAVNDDLLREVDSP